MCVQSADDYLGRVIVRAPVIVLDQTLSNRPRPVLEWYPIMRRSTQCGQLLAAFELILDDDTDKPIPVSRSACQSICTVLHVNGTHALAMWLLKRINCTLTAATAPSRESDALLCARRRAADAATNGHRSALLGRTQLEKVPAAASHLSFSRARDRRHHFADRCDC